jgi:hypothetical protein
MRTPSPPLIAVVLFSGALAGCGDNGPTKADYSTKAEGICARANHAREGLQSPGMADPGPERAARMARYAERLKPVYSDAMKQLRAVEAPPEDAGPLSEMLDGFDYAFASIDPFITAAKADNEEEGTGLYFGWIEAASRPQGVAAKYGLDQCSRFGNP